MDARNLQPPFPLRRNALSLALRQVLQQRRWQALVAAGLVGLAPVSLGDPFPANLELSSLDGTNGFKLSGVAVGDSSGYSVSNAGDVNGDGTDDLLIGAPSADPNYSGASYVVFGEGASVTCNGLPATIVGTEASEAITGTSGPDVINGLGGDDRIQGLSGDDVICGGSGNDLLLGNNGADTLDGEADSDRCIGGGGSDSATNCEVVRNIP